MFLRFIDEVTVILKDASAHCGFELEDPVLTESKYADISSSVAFKLAPVYKKNPKEIADKIAKAVHLQADSLIERVEAAGPYINFYVSRGFMNETVTNILIERDYFGTLAYSGKVILEHTSANPDGPLHVGHIRNSVIGDTLARILKRAGYSVSTQYYINDMGRQAAVVVWGLENFKFDPDKKTDHAIADVYISANRLLEKDPDKNKEIDALMQRNERNEPDIVRKFESAINTAMEGIKESLHRMNIHHDEFIWESQFVRSGAVAGIIERVKNSGFAEIDDGALVVDLKKYGIEKKLVVVRRDGTSLYTTRDLAYHEWKASLCDRMIDILGADHKLISSQLKAVLRIIGIKEPEIVIFEFVSLPEGSMSTRAGRFISADDLLDQVEAQAYREVEKRRPDADEAFKKEVAKHVGIGAVRYDTIKVSHDKAMTFDWRAALDFEKQGAPFIQYSHARACSIMENAKKMNENTVFSNIDVSLLVEPQEVKLIKKMSMFPYVIDVASRDLKPHLLAAYARELADAFNLFYRYVPVLTAEPDYRASRLALVECARIVLAGALDTLGIAALESM